VQAARDGRAQLVAPTTAVIEFGVGHGRDPTRVARVLKVVAQMSVTPEIAARAAWLLVRTSAAKKARPSVTDATVAAIAEIYGAVVSGDVDDMRALAAIGTAFEIHPVADLLRAMGEGAEGR
jgi:predicted nucleic acid-binding protein